MKTISRIYNQLFHRGALEISIRAIFSDIGLCVPHVGQGLIFRETRLTDEKKYAGARVWMKMARGGC